MSEGRHRSASGPGRGRVVAVVALVLAVGAATTAALVPALRGTVPGGASPGIWLPAIGSSDGTGPGNGTGSPSASPTPGTRAGPLRLHLTGPLPPPAAGALLGAWVKPPGSLTQSSRIAAVQGLEQGLGRRLDIVNTYRRINEPFPTDSDRAFVAGGATLMLSWAFDDSAPVASGALDATLRTWAVRLRDFNHPVLLRVRWEMDRPNLRAVMHSGTTYVAAWRHLRAVFAQAGVRNVAWVWCPTAEGFAGGYAGDFYPGDDQVDWLGVDVYAGTRLRPLADLLRPVLAWAAGHPKPLMLGEFGVSQVWGSTARAQWLREAATVIQANARIKAVCYFDSDPDGNGPNQRFALAGDPAVLREFAALATTTYFNPARR